MAIIGTITKQTWEEIPFTIDYSDVTEGAVASSISIAFTYSQAGLTSDPATVSGNVMRGLLVDGVSGQTYIVNVRATITVGGNVIKVEDEVKVVVKDVG